MVPYEAITNAIEVLSFGRTSVIGANGTSGVTSSTGPELPLLLGAGEEVLLGEGALLGVGGVGVGDGLAGVGGALGLTGLAPLCAATEGACIAASAASRRSMASERAAQSTAVGNWAREELQQRACQRWFACCDEHTQRSIGKRHGQTRCLRPHFVQKRRSEAKFSRKALRRARVRLTPWPQAPGHLRKVGWKSAVV